MSDMIGTRHTFASYFAVDTILKVLWREGFARGPQELVRLTWYRIRRLEAAVQRAGGAVAGGDAAGGGGGAESGAYPPP